MLVFSRQKGLTLVFRNDPLESLKVSSTFDSIPFVRDFLQKEIEGQLRILLMDELPAIIHRLSLRLWVPEYRDREAREAAKDQEEKALDEPLIDPLAAPPEDPVDATGNALNPQEIASLSLDSSIETHALFSRKNLLRLATLTDSHRTLSLFTPSLRDTVFRAWANSKERPELLSGFQSPRSPAALSRSHSYSTVSGTGTTYSFDTSHTMRPGLSHASSYSLSMGGVRNSKVPGGRKRKKRVVNLRRRNTETGELESISGDSASFTTESTPISASSAPPSAFGDHPSVVMEPTEDGNALSESQQGSNHRAGAIVVGSDPYTTPPRRSLAEVLESEAETSSPRKLRPQPRRSFTDIDVDATPRASMYASNTTGEMRGPNEEVTTASSAAGPSSAPLAPMPNFAHFLDSSNSSSILEQAWMMKMASEMARRYQEQKEKEEQNSPPPAYTR